MVDWKMDVDEVEHRKSKTTCVLLSNSSEDESVVGSLKSSRFVTCSSPDVFGVLHSLPSFDQRIANQLDIQKCKKTPRFLLSQKASPLSRGIAKQRTKARKEVRRAEGKVELHMSSCTG